MSQRRPIWSIVLRLALLCLVALAAVPGSRSVQVARAAAVLKLRVESARTEPKAFDGSGVTKGAKATAYKWIINEDNVGDPSQARFSGCYPYTNQNNTTFNTSYPDSCKWPSIKAQNGYAPIVAQGDQNDIDETTGGLDISNLPNGKYLISVWADGYKLDGQWFSVPLQSSLVKVAAQPLPLPSATIRVQVFEDNSIVNGAPDIPAERGLPGFRGLVFDVLGPVSTDVFGNPICTQYQANGDPIPGTGGNCYSDADGIITIPNLGPNRYTVQVTPPNGEVWAQTTTLEGNKDFDTWVQEGATGNDTEFSVAGEPFPFTVFGFVKPQRRSGVGDEQPVTYASASGGEIKGVVAAAKVYVPLQGGLPYNGAIWGGFSGAKIDKPIEQPWIALNDLNNGDQTVYVGRGKADGSFDIRNVPDGSYTLTYWDDNLTYILDMVNVTVTNGSVEDTGVIMLTGWWSTITGKICNDLNSNGKCDSGEPGLSSFPVATKRRTNSLIDRGTISVFTDSQGNYAMENLYPLTQWVVIEAYSDRYYTSGVTWQADNQASETTVLGQGVDVNVLPIIGQSGRLDWALKPYDATGRNGGLRNGGIVGTVSYDTTRNELDPRFAAVENWQVGVPGLTVDLYAPIACATPGPNCVANPNGGPGYYQADASGALTHGKLLNTYLTESWTRPKGCVARGVDMQPVPQLSLPPNSSLSAAAPYDCLEAPLSGTQFGTEYATVDGNYGFGDGCFTGTLDPSDPSDPQCSGGAFEALPAGDYLVEVEIPNDKVTNRPLYKFTREEDINVFSGDQYIPQVPPSACAGALHTVDVAGILPDGPDATDNPTFVDMGGSPYEGQQKPICNAKFVTLNNGRSIAPTFNVFTDVPVPGRYFGYTVDDLNIATNPRDLFFGEKRGIDNVPMGIYDYTGRLVTTVNTDPNGVYEVLLPSTDTISCPTPSGVCANLYRNVGNDPGIPGHLNPNYNPVYRTIAATFEVFPGDIIPADTAPTTVGVSIQSPSSQLTAPASCALDTAQPQLFAVTKPFLRSTDTNRTITVTGVGFGASPGQVKLGTTPMGVSSWSDRSISFTVPTPVPGFAAGTYQLSITGANGMSTVNGLTFHLLGTGYTPTLFEVDPSRPASNTNRIYHAIQDAIDAAQSTAQALVVVYPGGLADSASPNYNPHKAYYENLLINAPVKLQGVGPGGVYADKSVVDGSNIDGGAFGGDTAAANNWRAKLGTLTWSGYQTIGEGAVVTLLAQQSGARAFGATYKAAIDGFTIQGGDQQGFPTNINVIGGTPTGQTPAVEVQGGAIYANAYASNLQITNNVVRGNGGAYGSIRFGTPNLIADPDNASVADNNNNNVRIANNRIVSNGGTNLAGAVGLFNGTDGYEIAANDFCGNFSAEYGGAISQYGRSDAGDNNTTSSIHDNRIWFNQSYDEGGAIMIAGELPSNPNANYNTANGPRGAGAVRIYNNRIQSNLSNDDGGGIRLLMAGNFQYDIFNNMIVNNISTHEGAGIALDDAPNTRIYNNTIMKNITTATAATSNGTPAPAGLATNQNSAQLRGGTGLPLFSPPVLFNNIFWDNRAGTWNGGSISGIGLPGDPNPINVWDLGVPEGSGSLAPTNSVIQQSAGAHTYTTSTTNSNIDPKVVQPYDTSVAPFPWRGNPGVVGTTIVALDLPPNLMGDYHLLNTASPAYNSGASSKTVGSLTVSAPAIDIDGTTRPQFGAYDIGADELRAATANLSITKTDGQSSAPRGSQVTYTITVANAGPDAVSGATVNDTVPATLTGVSWACTATAGSSCGTASGTGSISSQVVNLLNGGSATFTLAGTVPLNTTATSLANTASVAAPAGTTDPSTTNNTSTDTDTIIAPLADLSITKTDGQTSAVAGTQVQYTIVVANAGPNAATGATVNDAVPGTLASVTWTCTASSGSSCGTASGTGSISNRLVNLASGGSATLVVRGTLAASASGSLANTATVAAPSTVTDSSTANNTATDTDTIQPATPALNTPLDTFNRANANTLNNGSNWSQTVSSSSAAIRVDSNQAFANSAGTAYWNNPTSGFNAKQAAGFTFATTPVNSTALLLKASGGTAPALSSFIRVLYSGGTVTVATTTNGTNANPSYTTIGSFAATFASGDRLLAQANADGSVDVWKITAANATSYLGHTSTSNFTGSGRVGIQLPANARVDDFRGATIP